MIILYIEYSPISYYPSFVMFQECYEHIKLIAKEHEFDSFENISDPFFMLYHQQAVNLLRILFSVQNQLQSNEPAKIAKIIPIILNTIIELNSPEVITF
jgi:hypothetical protein